MYFVIFLEFTKKNTKRDEYITGYRRHKKNSVLTYLNRIITRPQRDRANSVVNAHLQIGSYQLCKQ